MSKSTVHCWCLAKRNEQLSSVVMLVKNTNMGGDGEVIDSRGDGGPI